MWQEVKTIEKFDAAHMLEPYKGSCGNVHGHTWLVEVTVSAQPINGMVCDFRHIKEVIKEMDHVTLIGSGPKNQKLMKFLHGLGSKAFIVTDGKGNPIPTTAENISLSIRQGIENMLTAVRKDKDFHITVAVYESPPVTKYSSAYAYGY